MIDKLHMDVARLRKSVKQMNKDTKTIRATSFFSKHVITACGRALLMRIYCSASPKTSAVISQHTK